jgi:flagellar hook-length control protein FliK
MLPSGALAAVMAAATVTGGPRGAAGERPGRAAASATALAGAQATSTNAAAPAQAQSAEAIVQSVSEASASAALGTPAAGSSSLPLAGPVGMQEMIDAIHATIELAARQGATQARIALAPAELGHISIRLSQTSGGLLARVTADTQAAAQALADGRAELHHSLSSLNLPLLRLDIGTSAQTQTGGHQGQLGGDGAAQTTRGTRDQQASDGETALEDQQASVPAGPSRGELVDVLA